MLKTKEELRNLYDNQLKSALLSIEGERMLLKKKYIRGLIGLLLPLAALLIFQDYLSFLHITIAFLIVAPSLYYLIQLDSKKKAYRAKFKKNVVSHIVKLINPDWDYQSDSKISSTDFDASRLFPDRWDKYNGDDFVSGRIGKTDFQFSELNVKRKVKTSDNKTEWQTVFKGLFAYADFNKEIQGQTFVFPEVTSKLLKVLSGGFGVKRDGLELIKLENPEFEKRFMVYGSNQIESRYVITPAMMVAMLSIDKNQPNPIHFSFVGSRVYIAMSFGLDLFEPRIFSSGLKFEDMEQMNEQFRIIQTIVEEMNLNTRIWTKD